MGACCGSKKTKLNFSKSPCSPVLEPSQYSPSINIKGNKLMNHSSSSLDSNASEKTRINNSVFQFKNGDHYSGDSLDNQPHGEGRYIASKGFSYSGYWKRGNPHGIGQEVYANKQGKFQGEYEDGVKNGYGKITFEDGSIYEGQLVNDNVEGYGILFWPDEKVYRGLWKKNKMAGRGRMEWPNGMYYEGQYENDLKHGFGIFYYGKGRKMYVGFWKKGKLHGKGLMRNEKGEDFQGVWNEGKLLMKCDEKDSLDFEQICQENGFRVFF